MYLYGKAGFPLMEIDSKAKLFEFATFTQSN